MLLEDDVRQLFRSRSDHKSFLIDYAKIANTIMYESEEFIREVSLYLRSQIIECSKTSPIYDHRTGIISKYELDEKHRWYNDEYNAFENCTSGSTGSPFRYMIWNDVYEQLECTNHYKYILDEFGISGPTKILHLHFNTIRRDSTAIADKYRTQNILVSHGLKGQAEIHSAIANKTFHTNYYKYYEDLIEYIVSNDIDIIHAQSNAIASLAWNMKRLKRSEKLCKLISNTGSKLNVKPVIELQQGGHIDAWCDHMRCWDGGVTFFTCKYNTYHLLDSLAWAYSDDYRLISYDYFSLPSPFVNYWNGDYADISNEYERCRCGRAFRRFEIGRTRSKASQIADSSLLQSAIIDNELSEGIIRADIIGEFIRIFTKYSLHSDRRKLIKSVLPSIEVQFTVEEDLNE